jgi:phosphoribosylformylglycinamidine synthase
MLWEVDIRPKHGLPDLAAKRVAAEAVDLGLALRLNVHSAQGFLVQGNLDRPRVEQIARELLSDRVVQDTDVIALEGGVGPQAAFPGQIVHVLPKPGVMDPTAQSAMAAIADFGIEAEAVRTFKKYWIEGLPEAKLETLCAKLLANDAIEQAIVGPLRFTHLEVGSPYQLRVARVAIRSMDDAALARLSREGQLYLSLVEMQTIQTHFRELDRDPTDVELESIAQTWSEHCSHKTLAGRIAYRDESGERHFKNMLKETIFAATVKIREMAGDRDFCVSVFNDNAGVVRFNEHYNVCFKVETHNHPSALEPYGGANTGLGGVIRDPMGTGMGAKPVANTDVFCFAPPDFPPDELPPGVLHPRRVMKGVVSGVRDYGNRMGIPTVNGAVYFDRRYLGNPLVFCGNIGLIPRDKSFKEAKAGDLIVALGGRTGRDGIHGATFSSAELTSQSETVSGGAVQIGNAITEKMLLDVLMVARDRGLYHAVTDCGAGGFSSAVGEMGEKIGAEVWLDRAPVKYQGLSYTEIWISEAQERMVLAVAPEKWDELSTLAKSEGVEATVIGKFAPAGRLILKYGEQIVADLTMKFLHDGRPPVVREAVFAAAPVRPLAPSASSAGRVAVGKATAKADGTNVLLRILGSLNVASKEWIIRQYDHEVQGGSVVKPLVGVANDGPGDAAVLRPLVDSRQGLVVSCGMNPRYGDFDPYWMAASAIDEALRNCVAVGADPSQIAILDNFCWGNSDRPETLGSLVRAALACYDMAIALGTPFVSGKDSLNNEFRPAGQEPISIPSSLLISAMGQIDDVARCVTMDLKRSGNVLYLIGATKNELGGSHYALVESLDGGQVPMLDPAVAKQTFANLHRAIHGGLVMACHDLSEGGLAVAAAEMAFSGGLGAKLSLGSAPHASDAGETNVLLFSESNSRFLCEVHPDTAADFETLLGDLPHARIGQVVDTGTLEIVDRNNATCVKADLAALKEAWQKPLRW